MYIIATFFDRDSVDKRCFQLKGKYLKHFKNAYPDWDNNLKSTRACLGYFAGRDNFDENSVSIEIKEYKINKDEIIFKFDVLKETDLRSGYISQGMRWLSEKQGWLNDNGMPPLFCFAEQNDCEQLCDTARKLFEMDSLMDKGEYKAALNLFSPLSKARDNNRLWSDADILYRLGLSCSKLAVTLKIKASETKKLKTAAEYRKYCEIFLKRGAELENDARCASALAYRYYSNVHELTRPGERKDQNLEEQIEKANEWLSRAIEIYPDSIRNNYRKGKLIVEKQAPYLLYGKRSFGENEARLLREIREVGEEHLASAIAIYESLEDENAKKLSVREYAKALFVLGGYYLDDSYLPVHEYFMHKIVKRDWSENIPQIAKLDIKSARENLEKCFHAETDMPLNRLDIKKLSEEERKWARSPIEKLYRMGCALSMDAFISLVEENADKAATYTKTALYYLEASKKVSDMCKDRKRNTWHISEKMAWAHIFSGRYEQAAKLLTRARAGYIVNTYAIALLLTGTKENAAKAKQALQTASKDKNNLAAGLTDVLLQYTILLEGHKPGPLNNLSVRN